MNFPCLNPLNTCAQEQTVNQARGGNGTRVSGRDTVRRLREVDIKSNALVAEAQTRAEAIRSQLKPALIDEHAAFSHQYQQELRNMRADLDAMNGFRDAEYMRQTEAEVAETLENGRTRVPAAAAYVSDQVMTCPCQISEMEIIRIRNHFRRAGAIVETSTAREVKHETGSQSVLSTTTSAPTSDNSSRVPIEVVIPAGLKKLSWRLKVRHRA
ncbi:MAG: uncharacterized protein KVP18_001670 [Porospora cf. gigantea A]|uniref:uncharacterized protein n=1 Tax=Porospora cf. gigantea A TaxID=2853593 RepID=UPI00355A10F5|nr:MAG: hypothetical protein KVP18_001670 [Porospora cf. gigantea A]